MAGSTGLEPATSGLTDDDASSRKHAESLPCHKLGRAPPLVPVGACGVRVGSRGHRTGTVRRLVGVGSCGTTRGTGLPLPRGAALLEYRASAKRTFPLMVRELEPCLHR